MYYGNIKFNAIEDGPGCRTVLFVSGCRNHCPGCFQKETWDFNYGNPFDCEAKQRILKSLSNKYVSGLTLCGGEPFEPENQAELLPFLQEVRASCPGKTIWSYSGYTFEQLTDPQHPSHTEHTMPMLELLDVLVDGQFKTELASIQLVWRGSSNQRILNMPKSLAANQPVLAPYQDRLVRAPVLEAYQAKKQEDQSGKNPRNPK